MAIFAGIPRPPDILDIAGALFACGFWAALFLWVAFRDSTRFTAPIRAAVWIGSGVLLTSSLSTILVHLRAVPDTARPAWQGPVWLETIPIVVWGGILGAVASAFLSRRQWLPQGSRIAAAVRYVVAAAIVASIICAAIFAPEDDRVAMVASLVGMQCFSVAILTSLVVRAKRRTRDITRR